MLAGVEASVHGAPYSLDLRERVVAAVADGMSGGGAAFSCQPFLSDPLDEAECGHWQSGGAADGREEAIRVGG
jgi:hypothetical protein